MGVDSEHYEEAGYCVMPGLFAPDEADALLDAILRAADPGEPNELSMGAMRFASNVYRRSSAVRSFLVDPRIIDLATVLLGADVWCRWDQAVCKGPGAGPFPWHQDNGYTRLDHEHLQVWVALTDAPAERGGLWVEPGAHRRPRIHRDVGSHVEVVEPPVTTEAIEARQGDVVAFSSWLPHATSTNVTQEDRWTYVAEFLPTAVEDPSSPDPRYVLTAGGRPVGRFADDRGGSAPGAGAP